MLQNVHIADLELRKMRDAIIWFAQNAKIIGAGSVVKEYTQRFIIFQLIYLDARVDNFHHNLIFKIFWLKF